MTKPSYPKRLIEVDLPIKQISEHARHEKLITHGHILSLHRWWARRPLAACRAVICAALWPDPADPFCPESFQTESQKQMELFWNPTGVTPRNIINSIDLRNALLDFIGDFADWRNSTDARYINTAQSLTQSAYEALGGEKGTRPLVVDPFSGGGSIPLEALRIGADVYASDLNPVPVLLNKVVLEYIPKYGDELANEVRKWGMWVKNEAEKELAEFYPKDPDGSTPIAYLWARTIICEGPGCGAEVPLIKSLRLANKNNRSVILKLIPNMETKHISFEIIENPKSTELKEGTVKRGSVTCPVCGYTTPAKNTISQIKTKAGATTDPLLYCVVVSKQSDTIYRLPTDNDRLIVEKAKKELFQRKQNWKGSLSLIPDELTPKGGGNGAGRAFSQTHYGMEKFEHLFTPRQNLMLATYTQLIHNIPKSERNDDLLNAVQTLLAITISKVSDYNSSLCIWRNKRSCVYPTFTRQAIQIVWDFGEMNPFSGSAGDFGEGINFLYKMIKQNSSSISNCGHCEQLNATALVLPSASVNAFITDPPYYDSVPYADLSDFFYVWLKRSIGINHEKLLSSPLTPKKEECIVDEIKGKDKLYFEKSMAQAMAEGHRILMPNGIGIVVFAHKSTEGWESQIKAMIDAGWVITGSWPIDTEHPSRLRSHESAALASSIHLVCRPRKKTERILPEDIGDWSDVLAELPIRIHEWMPRLKEENVIGADAIFACLGPALEIFSRYSWVEKASGEEVPLKEYLEKVWEAVEREALKMIFEGADAFGFEEDARLTAMWLWTLKAGSSGDSSSQLVEEETEDESEESTSTKQVKIAGYSLEYDAARKISQGLGAHPEDMPSLIEIKKGNARLLSVAERRPYLFGKHDLSPKMKTKKREAQLTLFPNDTAINEPTSSDTLGELSAIGKTTLDRIHQSMLLFGNGQSEALKKLLVEDGVGKDPQFKKLAQALVALYPTGSDEKRWAEGVMSRMKGLGL